MRGQRAGNRTADDDVNGDVEARGANKGVEGVVLCPRGQQTKQGARMLLGAAAAADHDHELEAGYAQGYACKGTRQKPTNPLNPNPYTVE